MTPSSYEDLVQFHSSSYVDFLKNANDKEGSGSTLEEDEYGIGDFNVGNYKRERKLDILEIGRL